MVEDCPFCGKIENKKWMLDDETAVALEDENPISKGHTLVVPRNHVDSVFDLKAYEYRGLWELVRTVRDKVSKFDPKPAGMNIGVNVGKAAGQTVMHAHVHVIPRYKGDVHDPRGGVRCVVPELAAYWELEGDNAHASLTTSNLVQRA